VTPAGGYLATEETASPDPDVEFQGEDGHRAVFSSSNYRYRAGTGRWLRRCSIELRVVARTAVRLFGGDSGLWWLDCVAQYADPHREHAG
jgi:hypothetical protein